jgi:hypothetical protein
MAPQGSEVREEDQQPELRTRTGNQEQDHGEEVEDDEEEEELTVETKEEEDSRVEDSGLGSASERTAQSEDRDSPGLSVIERARRLQGKIDKVGF